MSQSGRNCQQSYLAETVNPDWDICVSTQENKQTKKK
uniref:Uncharacterized protein n=1 Tax=Anguilla anguilla TaxID=7936 RepID=A0A0E9TSX5_ANGAN